MGLLITVFALLSGINDGGNLVGTYLSGSSVRPRLILCGLFLSMVVGPFLFGTRVSHTIAVEIVNFEHVSSWVLMMALFSAIATLSMTWLMKIPTSVTLALTGGMVGSAIATGDARWISWHGIVKVLVGLMGSVSMGFCVAFLFTTLVWRLLRRRPGFGRSAAKLQYVTVVVQGLAYGANDQEKVIGLAALWMMMVTHGHTYVVRWPAVVAPWVVWVAGLFIGGLHIAKTVNGHVFRLRGPEAVTTQGAAAVTVSIAALLGFPVSTTQTTDGSLFGTGTALNPYRVRWRTVASFLKVWVWTLPVSVGVAFFATLAARRLFPGIG